MNKIDLSSRACKLVALLLLCAATPAVAQLLRLPDRLPLPSVLSGLGAPVDGLVGSATARLDRVSGLLRAHPRELERGNAGEVVVRAEILAVAPQPVALAAALAAGFAVTADELEPALGVRLVTLRPPPEVGVRAALKRLRALDPAGSYDFDHIFLPGGGATPITVAPPFAGDAPGARVGLVDSGVATAHPVFSGARVETRGFAGTVVAAQHGTAVASLLVGPQGAARGARVFAADVYGGAATGGSARALVGAFGWLAGQKVGVVNVSLVGPPNLALRAAVDALRTRGTLVVAAVGNDGPAAPPLYPASYPGVVAVTGLDVRGRPLPEAGRAAHVDFAALAMLRAADPGGGFSAVRGTSFAAPLIAGRLARLHPVAAVAGRDAAVAELARDGIAIPRR